MIEIPLSSYQKVTTISTETVKARFYAIDTLESTGCVQEYGMAASKFTMEKLKNAAENGIIVLAGVSNEYRELTKMLTDVISAILGLKKPLKKLQLKHY